MGEFGQLDSFLSGAGARGSSTSAQLPAPVSPAWYCTDSKAWFGEEDLKSLSKAAKASLTQCSLLVQYAPTDRSSCRRCGVKIEKGLLRLGYPHRYRSCDQPYNVYLHAECYVPEVFGIKEKELRSRILGYEALNNTERARLWKAMRSQGFSAKDRREAKCLACDFSSGCVGVRTKIPSVEVPKTLVKPLLPFQKEGLSWMCQQEESNTRGGVLADEMGMGKTIQAISLLLARPLKGPCLIVCPMAAVHQWVSEIQRFTTPGTLKTLVYHGSDKANQAASFRRVDVVVTTYQTLETDYRREMNKQRVACKYCGKLFLPEKLAFHQRYFCGPDAIRTAKQQRTEKKFKEAAVKGMQTLGIGQQSSSSSSSSSTYQTPTITNIYRDYMKQAGVDVKARGYWNVMKEARERMMQSSAGASSSSSSAGASSSKDGAESLSRERLAITDREELKTMCQARGLDSSGRKRELIDLLMDYTVRGSAQPAMARTAQTAKPSLKEKVKAKAKAKVKAKAQGQAKAKGKGKSKALDPVLAKIKPRLKLALARPGHSSKYAGVAWHKQASKWQATGMGGSGKYLGLFSTEVEAARAVRDFAESGKVPEKKGTQAASVVRNPGDAARTVASEKAAREGGKKAAATSTSSKTGKVGKAGKAGKEAEEEGAASKGAKGLKRKRSQMEAGEVKTWEGPQIDLSSSPLHACEWSRIILDEGHRIKGRTNSTAMAAYALPNKGFKWCLTGTPMQNRIGELYSLIRFLRVRPFAFYYCRKQGCNCECARFMRERYCPNCGHIRFMHYSYFKSKVSNPIIKFGFMGAGKEAFQTLRDSVLNQVMLRRTKEERKADLKLPPMKVVIRKDKLSSEEQDFYTSLYMQSCVKFDTYVKGGTILHNYAHIFDLLTSLRRAVDHPYLIVHGGGSATHKLPSGERIKEERADICGLCQDAVREDGEETKRVAKCGHAFHDDCIRAYLEDAPQLPSGGVGCPVCFTRLSIDLGNSGGDSDEDVEKGKGGANKAKAKRTRSLAPQTPPRSLGRSLVRRAAQAVRGSPEKHGKGAGGRRVTSVPVTKAKLDVTGTELKLGRRSIMQKVKPSDFKSSTKIEALCSEVQRMIDHDPTGKGLVFSQFGAMLELVEFRLKCAGVSCIVFRGGMTMQARNDALVAFNTNPAIKVILISLKAGGEGLNLQVANHVFMLDPWWNPACELQAIQRAHRIGQTREVRAVRFITIDTIEEKIVKLQEKKQLVFDACIDASQGSMTKLTEQDLRFLFQH